MKVKHIVGVVVGTTILFSGCVAPASAINNVKGFGVQETLKDYYTLGDFSSEIGYTVRNLRPSRDVVPFPVSGRLYEANVTTTAVAGTVVPQINNFLARTPGGADYRVLSGVSTLSGAPLGPEGSASGKLYFDVIGENPDSIIYNDNLQDLLGWVGLQPVEVVPDTDSGGTSSGGGSSSGSGSADSGGSTQGTTTDGPSVEKAAPPITGPAPLPPEEQGLPG